MDRRKFIGYAAIFAAGCRTTYDSGEASLNLWFLARQTKLAGDKLIDSLVEDRPEKDFLGIFYDSGVKERYDKRVGFYPAIETEGRFLFVCKGAVAGWYNGSNVSAGFLFTDGMYKYRKGKNDLDYKLENGIWHKRFTSDKGSVELCVGDAEIEDIGHRIQRLQKEYGLAKR